MVPDYIRSLSSRLSKKPILIIQAFLITFLFLLFWRKNAILTSCRTALAVDDHFKPVSSIGSDVRRQKHKRIAIASNVDFHYDVYLALAWTLERVMKGQGQIDVYAQTPLRFEFGKVIQQLGLYHGVIKNRQQLFLDLADHDAIDMVILGTCELECVLFRLQCFSLIPVFFPPPSTQHWHYDLGSLRQWHEQLLNLWELRDDEHKFELVCIVHHVDNRPWHSIIPEWSRRNALRVLTISEQFVSF